MNRMTPSQQTTSANSVVYAVTFDQAVAGVDALDFKVTTTGSVMAGAPLVVAGSGATYSITVNGIRGSGDLRLDLIDNDSILAAGLALGGAGAANGSFLGQSYTVLQIFPIVVAMDRAVPADPTTSASSVQFAVTFSQAVTGVDPTDFQVVKTGTIAPTLLQVTPVSASVYTVTIGGITGDGTLGLNLVDNGSIRDLAGNPLTTANVSPGFASQVPFATGTKPIAPALRDVNGDGKPDLAVANYSDNLVSVLLGNGDGTFQARQTFATGGLPYSVVLDDLNKDGKPDLAVANTVGNAVSVLLGNGNGSFQGQQTFATGSSPNAVTVGDVNGDGNLDLAVANYHGASVSLLLGNGDGTFQAQQTFAVAASPDSVALGDVDGDGKPDLAVANQGSNSLSLLLGNGNGSFQKQQTFATSKYPNGVAIADLNGDGKPDLAVANFGSNTVGLLLGNGNGTFQSQRTAATGKYPISLAIGDVNGDGKPDLATANLDAATVSVLLGNGNGTFQAHQALATGTKPDGVKIADVNGDGKTDLIVANYDSGTISVLLANRNGNFSGQTYTVTPSAPPQLLSVTPNGNIASLAGNQRSRIASLVVVFDQPVQLDPNAVTLALHTNNVSFNGVLQPSGFGSLPSSLNLASSDNITWIVTFTGNTEAGADGLESLKDGVYDVNIDAAKVHLLAAPAITMVANQTMTFHRLYGDTGPPSTPAGGTPGSDFSAVLNSGDNLAFRAAFNKPAGGGYQPFLDFNGDGIINSADNLQFRSRFNKSLTWRGERA